MPIGALNTATPSSGDVAGTSGPNELKDIKTQVKASFPNFTPGVDVCNRTGPQLDDAARQSAAATITGLWNFTTRPTLNSVGLATLNDVLALPYGQLWRSYSPDSFTGVASTWNGPAVAGNGVTADATLGRLTVSSAGVYEITVDGTAILTLGSGSFSVRKNGSTALRASSLLLSSTGVNPMSMKILATLAANDYIDILWSGSAQGDSNYSLTVRRIA